MNVFTFFKYFADRPGSWLFSKRLQRHLAASDRRNSTSRRIMEEIAIKLKADGIIKKEISSGKGEFSPFPDGTKVV